MEVLQEIRVKVRKRPIIPYTTKLKHKRYYILTRYRRKIYNRLYRKRVHAKFLNYIRRKVKKNLGARAKRLKVFLR